MKAPIRFQNEEQAILRELKREGMIVRPLVVAVSGGCDSMVLLAILQRLNPILQNKIAVAHLHHGPAETVRQKRFRDRTQALVRATAKAHGFAFFTATSRRALLSENDCREFRWQKLRAFAKKWARESLIVTAHHRDDLLETQMMRLIRGTSLSGLQGFSFRDHDRLRPLVPFSRAEIENLAERLEVKWVDDPSNKSTEPLRNWLRHEWLPALEKKQRGATRSLARSLSTIAGSPTNDLPNVAPTNELSYVGPTNELSRQKLMSVEPRKQRQIVAQYLRNLGVIDYSQGQIEEILRRLDNRRREFKFTVLRHEWRVNAQQITAVKSLS